MSGRRYWGAAAIQAAFVMSCRENKPAPELEDGMRFPPSQTIAASEPPETLGAEQSPSTLAHSSDAGESAHQFADAQPSAHNVTLPVPPGEQFTPNAAYPACIHPAVLSECDDDWCRIPAGCFIWGSPEGEPNRSLNVEEQGPVTLTRSFEVMRYEVTIQQWRDLGFMPEFSPSHSCREPECPVSRASWYHALQFANALSQAHEPPLPACYEVEKCSEQPSKQECALVQLTVDSLYECEGYRLPSGAEWQYAARGGTTTSFYSGNITITQAEHDTAEDGRQLREPMLDPIAWYLANSGGDFGITHPVGQKLPNAWGLFDVLGNAGEWTHQYYNGRGFEFPATDHRGDFGSPTDTREVMGGSAIGYPSLLRVTAALDDLPQFKVAGLRLVRTLSD